MNLRLLFTVLLGWLMLFPLVGMGGDSGAYSSARQGMVKAIEADARRTSHYIGKAVFDARVMSAMGQVPRHEFVPFLRRPFAYENRPLAIGHGQTISQPYIVALMSDLVGLERGGRVLEIGTGSGYQAAILAEMGAEVYTIEIIEPLGKEAAKRLQKLGYRKVKARVGDGYYGWESAAPFDAIVVTAAASHVPPPLIKQLKPGGRMVIPVGSRFMVQQLLLVEKDEAGEVISRQMLPVRFVPLTGEH
ncbi:protein-L-isoaspartate(D-aspartate) O-methyltransferase [Pseudomonadota bacterium]